MIRLLFSATKKNQIREMEALRQTLATPIQSLTKDAYAARIEALEEKVGLQDKQIEELTSNTSELPSQMHVEGFEYLFEFTPERCPLAYKMECIHRFNG